jgi:hypothetical protein
MKDEYLIYGIIGVGATAVLYVLWRHIRSFTPNYGNQTFTQTLEGVIVDPTGSVGIDANQPGYFFSIPSL